MFPLLCQTPKQPWDFPCERGFWRFPSAESFLVMALTVLPGSVPPPWQWPRSVMLWVSPLEESKPAHVSLAERQAMTRDLWPKITINPKLFHFKRQLHLHCGGNEERPFPTIPFVYFSILITNEHNSEFLTLGMSTHPITINSFCIA